MKISAEKKAPAFSLETHYVERREILKSRTGLRWVLWDFVIGLIACMLGYYFSPYKSAFMTLREIWVFAVPFAVILSFVSKMCDVPRPCQSLGMARYDLLASSGLAVTISLVVFLITMYTQSASFLGRYIAGAIALLAFAGMVLPRMIVSSLVKATPVRVMIYGAGKLGEYFCSRIEGREGFGIAGNFEILGFIDDDQERQGQDYCGHKVLGSMELVEGATLRNLGVDMVVLCADAELTAENASRLLNLPLSGVEILTKAAFIEEYYKEVSVRDSQPLTFAAHRSLPGNAPVFAAKRVLDVVGALTGLLLTLPFWPILAAAIKLSSPGPVFFSQTRVGFRGRNFEMLKFRTMRQDAEKDGAQWAVEGDPRVTRFGKFLRTARLDELPQLINVLRGDMALVGPRPERPEFVCDLVHEVPFYARRHLVPPGLTGWAQIHFPYAASKEDALRKLQFDLYYIRHLSLGLDLQIIIKTIPMMMKGSR